MDKLKETMNRITSLNKKLMREAQIQLDNLTKPQGSLGRLEEFAKIVVGISGNLRPLLRKKVIFIMVGDHGVVEEGVSAYPQEVTLQMVYNFLRGGGAINVLASHVGAKVIVVDMGIKEKIHPQRPNMGDFKDKKISFGTKNMTKGEAMRKEEAIRAIEAGIEVFEEEYSKERIDIVGIGEMGIGNTTSSSAITAVLIGEEVEKVTGRGTGINEKELQNKLKVIKRAIEINKPNPEDPFDVLHKLGGLEIAGLVGVILSAASYKVPVVLDGFITGAAALIAYKLKGELKNYMIASHCSAEKGHKTILDYLGLSPILSLGLCLGEGTGGALGITLIEGGVKILSQMATFKEAGVSKKNEAFFNESTVSYYLTPFF